MAREDPHFRLRLPADLKAYIEAQAEMAGRSINAEILFRLNASKEADRIVGEPPAGNTKSDEWVEYLRGLEGRIADLEKIRGKKLGK